MLWIVKKKHGSHSVIFKCECSFKYCLAVTGEHEQKYQQQEEHVSVCVRTNGRARLSQRFF